MTPPAPTMVKLSPASINYLLDRVEEIIELIGSIDFYNQDNVLDQKERDELKSQIYTLVNNIKYLNNKIKVPELTSTIQKLENQDLNAQGIKDKLIESKNIIKKLIEENQKEMNRTNTSIQELALKVAEKEMSIGAREIDGNNMGYFVKKYQEHLSWLNGEPWCGSFVTWCFLQASKTMGKQRILTQESGCSAFRLRNWANAHKVYHNSSDRSYTPKPGDIFLIGTKHVGLVKEFIESSNNIITIEGNTKRISGQVSSFPRKRNGDITGYISLDELKNNN